MQPWKKQPKIEVDQTKIKMKPVGRGKADEIMAASTQKISNLKCKKCKQLKCKCP